MKLNSEIKIESDLIYLETKKEAYNWDDCLVFRLIGMWTGLMVAAGVSLTPVEPSEGYASSVVEALTDTMIDRGHQRDAAGR